MSLRNLLVSFDVAVSGLAKLTTVDDKLKEVLNSVKGLSAGLRIMAAILGAGAVIGGIVEMTMESIKQADALKHNAERLGLTTDELQNYEYAAGLFGVSTKETAVALRFFNRVIGEAQLGTKSAIKTIGQMGISMADVKDPTATTATMLVKFSQRLEKIPNQFQRTAFAMRTLGRNGSTLLPLLQRGSKELQRIFADVEDLGGGFNEKFVQAAHETDVELKRLKLGWLSLKTALVTEMLPPLKWVIEQLIVGVKWIIDIAKHTYGFRTALIALGITIGAIVFAFTALNPAFWALAAVIGVVLAPLILLYLAFDSLYTFIQGGDSVLGRFLDKLGGYGAARAFRKELVDAFQKVWAAIEPLMPQLKKFAATAIQAFADTIPYVIEWGGIIGTYVVGAIDTAVTALFAMYEIVEGISHLIGDLVEGRFSDLLGDAQVMATKIGNTGKGWGNRIDAYGGAVKALRGISHPFSPADAGPHGGGITPDGGVGLPPPPPPGANGQPKLSFNIDVTNNITGASDLQGTADAVGRATKGAVKSAITENRDAFAAVNLGMPTFGTA